MRHKTHTNITRSMFPWIKPDVIQKVNSALDSPTKQQIAMSKFMPNMPIPGLVQYPHRKYTHNMAETFLTGYQNGGMDGVYAALAHQIGDMVRDRWVSQVGGYQADIFEANYNALLGQQNKRR
jgi:hypothetical protein